jgi:hypothetical protein
LIINGPKTGILIRAADASPTMALRRERDDFGQIYWHLTAKPG